MSDVKCPFCGQKMRRTNGAHNKVGVWQCQNSNDPDNVCIASGYLFNDDVLNYITRTRKALNVATKYIKHTQKVSPFWFNRLANKTLDKIKTALEQKDAK